MPRKITSKRKGKFRRTLRRNRKQKGGDDDNSNNTQTVDEYSQLSKVMRSLPSNMLPRRIDNKLLQAFEKSGIDDAWRRLVTDNWRSQPLVNILKRIKIDNGEEESNLYDPEILYLLLISRAWMVSFVKENNGYERAREKFIQQTRSQMRGDLYSIISKNIEQFLETLSYPKIPTEYNKLMKHIWDNPELVLTVASYVFGLAPINQNDTSRENENDSVLARRLNFDVGGKKRKSRKGNRTRKNKGKKITKKTISKRRTRKSIRK